MKNPISFWTSFLLGSFLITFAFVGYQRTGSAISLVSGAIFGTLLLVSSWVTVKKPKTGTCASLSITLFLTCLFLIRTVITYKPVPTFLALLCAFASALLIIRRRF